MSSLLLDHGSKLRGSMPKAVVWLHRATDWQHLQCNLATERNDGLDMGNWGLKLEEEITGRAEFDFGGITPSTERRIFFLVGESGRRKEVKVEEEWGSVKNRWIFNPSQVFVCVEGVFSISGIPKKGRMVKSSREKEGEKFRYEWEESG
ncbi:hypothetical protein TNCV_2304921 [Trichonephila clavipes]|nr:hypothetical protein TNCV_2304921 [Trichonephila clavipes]